jgi:glutathione S-transferase
MTMHLVGMLDSPYVRRVAVSLRLLGLPYVHNPLSVFRTFDEFRRINPVVKAPTLVCDDGEVLMDSTLILQHAEALAAPRTLMPGSIAERQHALRFIGLALAACEKSIQIVYEDELRPPEKKHQPWVDRVASQMTAAYAELEAALARRPLPCDEATITQAGVSVAVAWSFTQMMLPGAIAADRHPLLAAFAGRAEQLPAFLACPQR